MTKGLGRGLSSLIPPKMNSFAVDAEIAASSKDLREESTIKIYEIPLQDIERNPQQPRQHFDQKSLEELQVSILEYGLLEPIVVTPVSEKRWQIVAGERRFRAFRNLQKKTIPAIIRSSSDLERLELALIENIQRQDLHPIEKAKSFALLINEFGLTQEQAAKKMGLARSSVANSIRLLDLPTEIQLGLAQGIISEGHAKVLLSLPTEKERLNVYHQMTKGAVMSVKDLASTIDANTQKQKSSHRSIIDYELQSVEDRLQSSLRTKVRIQKKQNGAKRIIIDTYSEEEFKHVIQKME
ncbi:MAG TPA: ParB/RepB/Spo0J family partition protein [Patescibacteria group bacterium]|nr:ParB/RepB/Spo0J family partition protein [Patescibacteria group bacterium]